jgi:hypothetical protein
MAAGQTGSNQNQGSSTASGLVSTLVPSLALAGVYVTIFLILRKKMPRNYAPRSMLGSLRPEYVNIQPSTLFALLSG